MTGMARLLGIVLIVLGVIGLVAGGITYTRQKQDAKIGPIEVEHTQHERVPISPIASAVALIAGAVLVAAGTSSARRGAR